jgi:anti-sigma regulatory factor (Ser/Thr protein kinase)
MTHLEPSPAHRCTIAAPDGLDMAVATAGAFASAAELSPGDTARLAVVVEEIVANLFDHGGLAEGGTADLSIARADGAIMLLLIDRCAAFDPNGCGRRAEHDERGGGVGLDLVRAWTDRFDYSSDGGQNRLSLRLPLRN